MRTIYRGEYNGLLVVIPYPALVIRACLHYAATLAMMGACLHYAATLAMIVQTGSYVTASSLFSADVFMCRIMPL